MNPPKRFRLACSILAIGALIGFADCAKPAQAEDFKMIAGSFPTDSGPDGDTYIFDASDGLVVIDTGRHIEHSQAILDYAKSVDRPISAIINTHWHLDHTTGNADIRAVYPKVKVYATRAAAGALDGFLAESARRVESLLADASLTDARRAGLERALKTIRGRTIEPTDPVDRPMKFAVKGRELEIYVADHAVTEADLWIYDPETRTAIVGDLVTVPAPFFDTACPAGWASALEAVASKPIARVAPGHGPVLSAAEFENYRGAFNRLLACAAEHEGATCAEGWLVDAKAFIPDDETGRAREMVASYVDEIIRSPEKRAEYCPAP